MNLNDLQKILDYFPNSDKMPVLFLGHGSPMNAIEENEFVTGFREISKKIPKPNAILCISAHWLTDGTFVTAMQKPRTIHDFYGFPQELFDVQYPAPGKPELASEISEILQPLNVHEDLEWGLDHGAWSVIKHLYPQADVPVLELSIDYRKPANYHFELAKKLQKLRNKGVLIIGSGNIVHNLRMVDFKNINTIGFGFDWAHEAREITNNYLLDGNFKPLLDWQNQRIALRYAIPTPDHYYPLLYSLGLKDSGDQLFLFNDELVAGSLSMTSVYIG